VVFPLLQALIIAAAGAALAGLLALSVAGLVNSLPLGGANPAGGRALCVIAAEHLLLAVLVSLVGAALSAAFAGYRAARIEPAEGLRDA
jgi:putative ABC transport system permease protein